MYYYIRTHYSGWQQVNKQYFREFTEYLRRGVSSAANRDEIIASRTRKSEIPLDITELMGGAADD